MEGDGVDVIKVCDNWFTYGKCYNKTHYFINIH